MKLQLRFRTACLGIVAASTIAAADLPYAGKWKLNPAKSDLAGTTITYSQTAAGEMQISADGMTFAFKTDGKEYPSFFGSTAAVKQLDASTWETTTRMKGQVLSVDTTKISADGKTMTIESKGTRPNGQPFDDTTVYQRVSGGPGLAGKWKTSKVSMSAPFTMELAASGSDGLISTFSDEKATCNAKFDGKDYPLTGPTMPASFTMAFKKTGDRSFEISEKDKGKEIYRSVLTVSADGKTLTEVGTAVLTGEKTTLVYDRQ